jgi:hypothetical protein
MILIVSLSYFSIHKVKRVSIAHWDPEKLLTFTKQTFRLADGKKAKQVLESLEKLITLS